MSKIYYKIHEYDAKTNSLVISYASDTTKSQNPDDYPKMYITPTQLWPDLKDQDSLIKGIIDEGVIVSKRYEEREKGLTKKLEKLYNSVAGTSGEVDI